MKKQVLSLCGLAAVVLLVGAGCAQVQDPSQNDSAEKSADKTKVEETDTQEEKVQDSIVLTAQKTDKAGEVYLTWSVPKSLKSDGGYRIVRSTSNNPVWPGSNWFHQESNRNHITWVNIPTGTHYFRICGFANNECLTYSNEVSVQVIGKAQSTAETFTSTRTEVEAVRGFYNALMSDSKDNALVFVPESVQATNYFKEKWLAISDWQFKNLEIRLDTITGDIFSEKKVGVVVGIKIGEEFVIQNSQITIDFRNGKWWVVDFSVKQ